ncbi:hypothetical protein L3X38_032637 [Prunus dulcis]|uniref:Uncharacterized protein n=1 Tax=Prunus dulcis TaxID=3755 RepID=A0AAD4VEG7_PRUDU|nr:hypothetical protein L3X38_032637 [Prunus dulcis]
MSSTGLNWRFPVVAPQPPPPKPGIPKTIWDFTDYESEPRIFRFNNVKFADEILGLLKGVVEELDFERSCMITLCKYLPQLLDFPPAALDVPAFGKNRLSVSLAALDVPACETLSICGVGCSGIWKDSV